MIVKDMYCSQLLKTVLFLQVLYHELHTLDRLEQDYLRKAQEEAALNVTRSGSGTLFLSSAFLLPFFSLCF